MCQRGTEDTAENRHSLKGFVLLQVHTQALPCFAIYCLFSVSWKTLLTPLTPPKLELCISVGNSMSHLVINLGWTVVLVSKSWVYGIMI